LLRRKPQDQELAVASHELEYEILGQSAQSVEILLDPGETVIAEAGAMNYMTEGVRFEARLGDGTHFSNEGTGQARVAFAAPYPGTVVPVDLRGHGGRLTCQKDSFLCAAYGTRVGIALSKRIGAGFFGGEGFVLQRLEGDGLAFLHAGGTVIRKELNNETLRLDTGCLVAFSEGIDYDIQLAGGLKSMLFGGEGLLLTTLRGTGSVWIQSLPFSRLAERVYEATVQARGETRAGGS